MNMKVVVTARTDGLNTGATTPHVLSAVTAVTEKGR